MRNKIILSIFALLVGFLVSFSPTIANAFTEKSGYTYETYTIPAQEAISINLFGEDVSVHSYTDKNLFPYGHFSFAGQGNNYSMPTMEHLLDDSPSFSHYVTHDHVYETHRKHRTFYNFYNTSMEIIIGIEDNYEYQVNNVPANDYIQFNVDLFNDDTIYLKYSEPDLTNVDTTKLHKSYSLEYYYPEKWNDLTANSLFDSHNLLSFGEDDELILRQDHMNVVLHNKVANPINEMPIESQNIINENIGGLPSNYEEGIIDLHYPIHGEEYDAITENLQFTLTDWDYPDGYILRVLFNENTIFSISHTGLEPNTLFDFYDLTDRINYGTNYLDFYIIDNDGNYVEKVDSFQFDTTLPQFQEGESTFSLLSPYYYDGMHAYYDSFTTLLWEYTSENFKKIIFEFNNEVQEFEEHPLYFLPNENAWLIGENTVKISGETNDNETIIIDEFTINLVEGSEDYPDGTEPPDYENGDNGGIDGPPQDANIIEKILYWIEYPFTLLTTVLSSAVNTVNTVWSSVSGFGQAILAPIGTFMPTEIMNLFFVAITIGIIARLFGR